MSVVSKRLTWNEKGEPKLTIVAIGVHDVYRLSHHLRLGQVGFARMGARIQRGLRRKLSRSQWDWLMRYMHGDGGFRPSHTVRAGDRE
jgi:hypothetical protein